MLRMQQVFHTFNGNEIVIFFALFQRHFLEIRYATYIVNLFFFIKI